MTTNKKNFREDRTCESCGKGDAALVSEKIDHAPRYLCKVCMKFGLNRRMTLAEIITMVENHWGIEADARVDKCDDCGSDEIHITSIDEERYFVKCGCRTEEGRKQIFRLR